MFTMTWASRSRTHALRECTFGGGLLADLADMTRSASWCVRHTREYDLLLRVPSTRPLQAGGEGNAHLSNSRTGTGFGTGTGDGIGTVIGISTRTTTSTRIRTSTSTSTSASTGT